MTASDDESLILRLQGELPLEIAADVLARVQLERDPIRKELKHLRANLAEGVAFRKVRARADEIVRERVAHWTKIAEDESLAARTPLEMRVRCIERLKRYNEFMRQKALKGTRPSFILHPFRAVRWLLGG